MRLASTVGVMAEITRRRVGELQRAVLKILFEQPEGLPAKEVLKRMEQVVPPSEFEKSDYPNRPGVQRFPKMVRFATIGPVKAGWMIKDKGKWYLTEEGDKAIQKWIDGQLDGKSCNVVLIGENTAGRKWIKYEIGAAWNNNKGLVGIYIHKLKDFDGNQSAKGRNPFEDFTVGEKKKELSSIVKTYNPPYSDSKDVYSHISDNLADWIEEAVEIRDNYQA